VDRVRHVILGIGLSVNVENFPPELRKVATSLKIESGEKIDRAELAATILRELDLDYARVCAGKFSALADEWETHCSTIGKNVVVQIGDRKIRGSAESLDDDGALLLRTEHGRLERIIGGDVTLDK
jgi:BirA family biotin operon repressor/biotin-[acetyl-CoA-carboxylase] ligase